ncbi:hypothetical protein GCM10009539_45420 [Cryptosporangium japonicum]|uniref:Uncharacterized protein n=1 Tax=Cryptosporangium japonicum TaxID=80872 RepID=A0ABN0UM50_9ACTN
MAARRNGWVIRGLLVRRGVGQQADPEQIERAADRVAGLAGQGRNHGQILRPVDDKIHALAGGPVLPEKSRYSMRQ